MQTHIDFCFADDRGTLVIAGWSTDLHPQVQVIISDYTLVPAELTRHQREDLRSSEPLGFRALFDISHVDWDELGTADAIFLKLKDDYQRLPLERLTEDGEKLVDIGVDESFYALLEAVAEGKLVFGRGALSAKIISRLKRGLHSAPRETEDYCLALEQVRATSKGQGVLSGWQLTASTHSPPLKGFAFDADAIVPLELFVKSLPRADLAPYGDRYRVTGRDGFCGSWCMPQGSSGAVQVVLHVSNSLFSPFYLASAENAALGQVAEQISTLRLALPDVALRNRLQRSSLPALPSFSLRPAQNTATSEDTLLILDHDLLETDLRDVLRRVGNALKTPLRLHLLQERLTPALKTCIEGAARELAVPLSLEGVCLGLPEPKTIPSQVLFARSSTLFQFDLAALTAAAPCVMVHDPIGLLANTDAHLSRFIRDGLTFAAIVDGPSFFSNAAQLPDCFLTQEARLRLFLTELVVDGLLPLIPAKLFTFFEGKYGPYSTQFPYAGDWHAYDAESRRLLAQEGLA